MANASVENFLKTFIVNASTILSNQTVKEKSKTFVDLVDSNSFVEGAKTSALVYLKSTQELPQWNDMPGKQKLSFAGRWILKQVSNRYNFAVLCIRASLDFVAMLVKAVGNSVLFACGCKNSAKRRWRQTGVALFTLLNSGTLGIINPNWGSKVQLLGFKKQEQDFLCLSPFHGCPPSL